MIASNPGVGSYNRIPKYERKISRNKSIRKIRENLSQNRAAALANKGK
jgi:hypothetical protein